MHNPRVLFLDEPTLGLDAQTRRAIWEYIRELNRREKVTIFLTTHYMEEADYLCDRVAIIDHGKILVVDTPDNLKNLSGRDVITVRCSDYERLRRRLAGEDWIRDIKVHNGVLEIYVERGEEKVPLIMKISEELKMTINSITLRKPSLEDVYLHFTGRTIREAEASPIDLLRMRFRFRGR